MVRPSTGLARRRGKTNPNRVVDPDHHRKSGRREDGPRIRRRPIQDEPKLPGTSRAVDVNWRERPGLARPDRPRSYSGPRGSGKQGISTSPHFRGAGRFRLGRIPAPSRRLPRASRRSAFGLGAQLAGDLLDPCRLAERQTSAERSADGLHLGCGPVGHHLASPGGPPGRLIRAEVGPLREGGQQGIGAAFAVRRVARPAICRRVGDHPGPERVGLDVAEDDPEVVIGLDDGTFETTLP
jgi:hypothetical protein